MTAILKVDEIQDTAGNLIIKEDSNTITLGASGDTITIPSGATLDGSNATLSGFATTNGITMSDQWRLTSNLSTTGTDITSNLERNDTTGYGKIGTGMSESSGIFTFPETGIYLIIFQVVWVANSNGDIRYAGGTIKQTSNNSTYVDASTGYNGCNNHGANYYMTSTVLSQFDVTNTTTHKVKFNVGAQAGQCQGDTSENRTSMTFLRLGDT